MDSQEELLVQAELGIATEDFVASEIGRFLVGCARQEAQAALEQLKNVDATDVERIRVLQNQIWRAESFEAWLGELVNNGREAQGRLLNGEEG